MIRVRDEGTNELMNLKSHGKMLKKSVRKQISTSLRVAAGSSGNFSPERVIHGRWGTSTFFQCWCVITSCYIFWEKSWMRWSCCCLTSPLTGSQCHGFLHLGHLKSFVYEAQMATVVDLISRITVDSTDIASTPVLFEGI
ncbi:hypothetical protein TNCV_1751421 [Trichonephila clavipes]|nr:hypothetical protein TNCV_1751421 [Trichonephila clavipes]